MWARFLIFNLFFSKIKSILQVNPWGRMRGKIFFSQKLSLLVGALFAALLGAYGLHEFNKGKKAESIHQLGGEEEGPGIETWSRCSPENGSFTVCLPNTPEYRAKELSIPRSKNNLLYHEYQCLENDKVISVSYTALPDNWLKLSPKKLLKRTIYLLLSHLKNTRLSGQTLKTFKSYPALDFQYRAHGRETAGMLVLCENVLYKLEISYLTHEHDQMRRQIAQFIASFEPSKVS